MNLLTRIGGALIAPRRLFSKLSPETGRRDGALLLLAYLLAVGLPALGDALADLFALGGLAGVLGVAAGLMPLLPWIAATMLVEWRLGETRAHRAALCLVPLLVIAALAHLVAGFGVRLPGPTWAPALLGGGLALALTEYARPAILPLSRGTGDLPEAPGPSKLPQETDQTRGATLVGLVVAALVAVSAGRDLTRLVRVWPTLAPVAAGAPAPGFAVPLLDGPEFREADLQGRPHLLIFWTTWCGVCLAEMPMYVELAARHPELQVIAVNADRDGDVPALARAYREAHALPFPIALDDGQLTRGMRVRMFPHLVLVDAAGQVRAVFQGRTFARSIDAAIAAL